MYMGIDLSAQNIGRIGSIKITACCCIGHRGPRKNNITKHTNKRKSEIRLKILLHYRTSINNV